MEQILINMSQLELFIQFFALSLIVCIGVASLIAIVMGAVDRMNGV